jgi:choline dehydrogenase-like flavoprotein
VGRALTRSRWACLALGAEVRSWDGCRKLWLCHRGRRVGGLCTGQPTVGGSQVPGCTAGAGGPDRAREIHIPVAFTKFFLTGYDWNFRTSKQPQLSDREAYWPAGKTLGGSSSINGQAWVRGHRVDYDGWAQSCPGWSHDEMLPYFQRAERRVGSNTGGVYGTPPTYGMEPLQTLLAVGAVGTCPPQTDVAFDERSSPNLVHGTTGTRLSVCSMRR